MENLIFSLNATLPIFFTMVLGGFFRKLNLFDDAFVAKMNAFVFKVALPVLVFEDIATVDFLSQWDTKFVLFCFSVTLLCILVITGLSYLWRDRSFQGEFVQASYRSSAAILGIAFIQNIYGNAGMSPLMIIASVPLYNMMAVVVLTLLKPERGTMTRSLMRKTLKGIVTNPIILGILAGTIWSVLRIPMPPILGKTVKNIGVLATPMGLMAMGATFQLKQAGAMIKPSLVAAATKLLILPAIFLPLAVACGFRTEKLIAILVMLGSSTTVSCFIMAKNMGHKGVLTSSVIMLTTLFSAFTLTGWLYLVKANGLI